MSQFLPPEGTPLPPDEPEAFNLRDASNALVQWFNAQRIKPSEALACMERVTGKLIIARTRPDVIELSNALDDHSVSVAHSMNDHLAAARRDARLNFKRRNGGSDHG